jgi:uncharacterized membrane protein YjjP (DUF1212 family)
VREVWVETKELSRDELKKIADTSLLIAKAMLESGAEICIVEESLSRLIKAFGCDRANLSVLPQTISMTLVSGVEFRTKITHIGPLSPNMERLSALHTLTKEICPGCTPEDLLRRSEALLSEPPTFKPLQKIAAASVACASFAALFHGSAEDAAAAFVATFGAALLKSTLDAKQFNPFFTITSASFVATLLIALSIFIGVLGDARIALASSVLFLVPGVQLINSFEDIIKGHYLSGIARGMHGMLVSFAIVFGISLGLKFWGVAL